MVVLAAASAGPGPGGTKKAACSVLTPEIAKVAMGTPDLPAATAIPQNTDPNVPGTCVYTGESVGNALVSVDLLLYYGHSAVTIFDETVTHSVTTVTLNPSPYPLKFSEVQVNGMPAYWQPNNDRLYGLISAADGNYVVHITMQGRTDSEPFLENALGAVEKNL